MEMQIIINGDYGEMLEALRCLADGHRAKAIVEAFAPVHHPHDVGAPARETILTPMGPVPIAKETATVMGHVDKACPGCGKGFAPVVAYQKYCSQKCYQKKYWLDLKSKLAERKKDANEVAPDANKVAPDANMVAPDANMVAPGAPMSHCHQCGTLFVKKNTRQIFCSKKCYMVEWREVNVKKAAREVAPDAMNVAPDAMNVAPDAMNVAPDAIYPVARLLPDEKAKALREKLDRIKATCPVPKQRPNITREL